MNLRRKLLLALLLIVTSVLWLAPARDIQAQSPATFTAKTVFDVNIRATPGINSGVLAVFPAGTQATAIGRSPGNNWIQVEYQQTTGWVAAWLVVFSGDTSLLPVTTDIQPEPVTTNDPILLSSPYNLNIRAEPNPSARILGKLPFATPVSALQRTSNSSWVRIDYNGTQGWVAAWLSTLNQDINGLSVGEGAASPTAQPTGTRTPNTPAPTPVPGTPAAPTGITITAPHRVNIRATPSTSGSVLTMMPFGAQAAAAGRNVGNNWIQVQYGNTLGWVAKWVVVASDNTVNLPVTSDVVDVTPAAGTTITGAGMYNVIIRTGPGSTFGEVGQLPANTNANLLGRTSDSAWIRLSYEGTEGWVASWVIFASGGYE
jgi:uncharacterized protein YraI